MSDCLFCRIIEGRELHYKVAESKSFIAILNLFPASPGHVLIMPKSHSVNLLDLPERDGNELLEFAQRVGQAVVSGMGADGFNFALNNGEAAGQAVLHTHFHVIPRKKNDGLHGGSESHHRASPEELVHWQREILQRFLP